MSVEEETQPQAEAVQQPAGSLRERLAERREQLQQEHSCVLAVPGYDDLLAARYRILPWRKLREIGRRNQQHDNTPDGEVYVAADTLIAANVELLEKRDDGSYASTGVSWGGGASQVAALFGVELREGATSREAILAALPETQLILHFAAYGEQLDLVVPKIQDELAGESAAA